MQAYLFHNIQRFWVQADFWLVKLSLCTALCLHYYIFGLGDAGAVQTFKACLQESGWTAKEQRHMPQLSTS